MQNIMRGSTFKMFYFWQILSNKQFHRKHFPNWNDEQRITASHAQRMNEYTSYKY